MYRLHIDNEKFVGWVKIVDDQMTLTETEDQATPFKLEDAHSYIESMSEYRRSVFTLKPVPKITTYTETRKE